MSVIDLPQGLSGAVELGLSFIQITANLTWPGLYLQRPHLALNQYQSSGKRNRCSKGGGQQTRGSDCA